LTESTEKEALGYFESKYNCAQSVFRAILEHKGLYFNEATQLAAGFGGGITHSGQQCGALSGAMMAIGVLAGRKINDVREHKAMTYDLTSELLTKFAEEFGTIRCDDLTGVNMSDQDALKKAINDGVFEEICPKFIIKSVEIVLEMFPD